MRCGHYSPRKKWVLSLVFLFWMIVSLGCATPGVSPPTSEEEEEKAPPVENHILKDIRVVDLEVHLDLERSGIKDVFYSAFKVTDPLRLVLELSNTAAVDVSSPLVVENEIVKKIETTTFVEKTQPFTRVVIGLNRDIAYLIDQGREEIWVQFYTDQRSLESAAARGEPVVHPEAEDHPAEAKAAKLPDTPQPTKVEDRPPKVKATMLPDTPQPTIEEPIIPSQPVAREALAPANKLLAIEPVSGREDLEVHIVGNGKLENFDILVLENPPRLVMDLLGVRSSKVKKRLNLSGPWVKRIRIGLHADKVRVVFDLTHRPEAGVPHQIISKGDRLIVFFRQGFDAPSP